MKHNPYRRLLSYHARLYVNIHNKQMNTRECDSIFIGTRLSSLCNGSIFGAGMNHSESEESPLCCNESNNHGSSLDLKTKVDSDCCDNSNYIPAATLSFTMKTRGMKRKSIV